MQVQLATKFGITAAGINGKPEYVKQALNDSLERLQVPYVDLYYQHRIDPNTPIEDTVSLLFEQPMYEHAFLVGNVCKRGFPRH